MQKFGAGCLERSAETAWSGIATLRLRNEALLCVGCCVEALSIGGFGLLGVLGGCAVTKTKGLLRVDCLCIVIT